MNHNILFGYPWMLLLLLVIPIFIYLKFRTKGALEKTHKMLRNLKKVNYISSQSLEASDLWHWIFETI